MRKFPQRIESPPVHVVLFADVCKLDENTLIAHLSKKEIERAKRYKKEDDFKLSICAHALKRIFLGNYLQQNPSKLAFQQNEFGKPFCLHPGAPHFNISHSGKWVALIFSSYSEVGIDVQFPASFSFWDIAMEVLSKQACAKLEKTGEWQDFLFFWTQKEALSKAYGTGMSLDFLSLETNGQPGLQNLAIDGMTFQLSSFAVEKGGVLSTASIAQQAISYYEVLDAGATLYGSLCVQAKNT